ncbi:decorin-binding protein DbpA [Borreliella carolinensis]|uniref:Decorin-binding protein DbpA n=1 Tax=Borreliella carolinensis TaxID=478174 RepID=A0ABY9E2T8_9SPIR|nr:decorin-binding protein DbpA [Borreliella carolinensis]WKC90374.1 decorin-binding protein DbpA [Borreliella carolinensis]WNY68201.1 decorin-binding protein DbpA [Borreliella carolinensis]
MNKYQKTFKIFNFKNLLKLTLLVALFISCGLTGETKIILERRVQDITDKIDQIYKAGALKGIKYEDFTKTQTGGKVSGQPEFIREAKLQAIEVAEKFLTAIEEEASKLKETGSSGEFSAMYNLMLEVSESLQKIGIQRMSKTVTDAAEKYPTTTAEGILEIAKAMNIKLQNVKTTNSKKNGNAHSK